MKTTMQRTLVSMVLAFAPASFAADAGITFITNLKGDVAVDGKSVISYEATKQRLQAEAASSAQSFSGAGTWIFAIVLALIGAAGVWCNRKLRAAENEAQLSAA